MKDLFPFLLCASISTTAYAQAPDTTGIKDLEELDAMIRDPYPEDIITSRAFDKSIYQDQQAMGGSTIKEGKVVGFNATVDDKSLTINGGTNILYRGNTGFVFQGTLKGQSEESFVTVFSGGNYGKTLGAGGAVLIFLPTNSSFYYTSDRKQLHGQLRQLRTMQEGQEFPAFRMAKPATNGGNWAGATSPYRKSEWTATHRTVLATLARTHRELVAAESVVEAAYRRRIGKAPADPLTTTQQKDLNTALEGDATVRTKEAAYQAAELEAASLLPTEQKRKSKPAEPQWPYLDQAARTAWLEQYVAPNGTIKDDAATHQWLTGQWQKASEVARQKRLKVYDSLQVAAPSSYRFRQWISLNGLSNVATQSVFAPTRSQDDYTREFHDYYFDGLAAYNGLWIRPWIKHYVSGGIGLNSMRLFEKKNRRTYVVSTSDYTGLDSVRVIKQSELYPTIPGENTFLVVQAQYSAYFTTLRFGVDLTGKSQYASGKDWRHRFTLGVFAPIQAGETTLLFMPQLRWATADEPHPFSFGFNLSASIPGFVTKDKTKN